MAHLKSEVEFLKMAGYVQIYEEITAIMNVKS